MDMHLVLDRVVAILVGGSVDRSGLDPTPGQPHGEAEGIVVPAHLGEVAAIRGLGRGRPPELAAPDHQGLIQQTASLEVL